MIIRFIREIIATVSVVILGTLLYVGFQNQKELSSAFMTLHEKIGQESKQEIRVVEKVLNQQPWAKVQAMIKDTVVQIVSQTAEVNLLKPFETPHQGNSLGSGFFISEEGEIITNMHVIDQAQSVWIKIPSMGKVIIDVEIAGKSPERDLALLRVTPEGMQLIKMALGKIPYLKLGDSDLVNRADEVLALGYPLGQSSLKSTSGVVSGSEHIGGRYLIQVSSPINPGSSGGPALNNSGEVIGITCSGIMGAQNVGYIIPVNELSLILSDLRTKRLLKRPFLGVLISNGSEDLAIHLGNPVPSGCYVFDIYPNGALDKADVKPGDMIYELQGMKLDEYGDLCVPWSEEKRSLIDCITRWKEGENITMIMYRNGTRKEIKFRFNTTDMAPIKKVIIGEDKLDYEIFGGMLFQPLTLNHVQELINHAPALIKYAEFKHQKDPVLIVTHIVPGSQIHRAGVIQEGVIIHEMNGKEIKTMKDLRDGIEHATTQERVVFKTIDGVKFVLNVKKIAQEADKLAKLYHHPMSSLIKDFCLKVQGKDQSQQG